MQVSVIIINYNTHALTSACIKSVFEKTKQVSFEIILVDNGSTECDASVFKNTFPSIRLICSTENLGFAGGNNVGIEHATGEYILLLNSDTELVNDAISIAVEFLNNNPQAGVVSGQLIYPDGRQQSVTGRFPSLKNLIELFRIDRFESAVSKQARIHSDLWDYSKPADTDWVWGAFFMFPANILIRFPDGKLQEDFFMYFEDVLWCYYIKKVLGLKVMYIPEPLIIHHLSGSNKQVNHQEVFINKTLPNQHAFLQKQHGRIYTWWFYFIKGLHLISLRKPSARKEADSYFNYVFTKRSSR